jgi:C-terminal processing protease CtpA/Prc
MGIGKSVLPKPKRLSEKQRESVFNRTAENVAKKYFDPAYNGTEWPRLARENRERIIGIEDPEQFELSMHDLVRRLGTSHTGFFHQSVRRVPARLAIGASFRKVDEDGEPRWVVQDVHESGPAHEAGLNPLDILLRVNGTPITPPDQPMFPMGAIAHLTVRRNSNEVGLDVNVPVPRSRKQPYAEPKAVTFSKLGDSIGYLKVSILPGLLGLDVARQIDAGVSALADCERLILDLRGHLGGGLGVLRLMSHLTPDKLPIGFTVTRRMVERGYAKEQLRRLDHLPTEKSNPLAILSMALKFAARDPSVLLVSEGLGPQKWHRRVVILTNEHTISAGEMVCAFARENNLAKVVGTETAGRLIPGSGFKVGAGYMLIMPKAAYITWGGHTFEGRGIPPDVVVPWSPEAFAAGLDNQLDRAKEVVCDQAVK